MHYSMAYNDTNAPNEMVQNVMMIMLTINWSIIGLVFVAAAYADHHNRRRRAARR